jgi:N-acetyl-gamma-glutamyl-phosphate reductase
MKHPVGIVGATGYTGEILLSLLGNHPEVSVSAVASRSHVGKPVSAIVPKLRGLSLGGLEMVPADPGSLASLEVDTWFLALPHGVAATYAEHFLQAGKSVIDLSADFRLNSAQTYETYYGAPHPSPGLLATTPYVLPELIPVEDWIDSPVLACPGCYPTSIQLPLVPLLRKQLASGDSLVINSCSGISGAGKKVQETYLYGERNESMKAYGLGGHRHLSEIEEQLTLAAGHPITVQFNPHLAPMTQGILSTLVVPAPDTAADTVRAAWEEHYGDQPFVSILPPGEQPDTRHVTSTNRADLAVVKDDRTGNLILTCAIDNLYKGAAGQAVQIFNLKNRFPQTTGLPN